MLKRSVIPINKAQKAECYRLRQEGYTLQWLGDKYGLSRERIRQIIEKHEEKLAGLSNRLSSCIYPELKKWMIMQDETYTSLASKCEVHMMTLRNGLTGRTTICKDTIDRILVLTGLTYEEAFRK